MNKIAKILVLSLGVMLVVAAPVFAQEGGAAGTTGAAAAKQPLIEFSQYFGLGLTVIGAAYGIGKLASSAYEGMSRQPEVAGNIQTAMIIAAALIEGFTFFALYICMVGNAMGG